MTGKAPGRVGDSPMVGAGTYADNATCAVSATGHGEFFIRYGAAFEIAARLRHADQSLHQAAEAVIEAPAQIRGPGGGGGGCPARAPPPPLPYFPLGARFRPHGWGDPPRDMGRPLPFGLTRPFLGPASKCDLSRHSLAAGAIRHSVKRSEQRAYRGGGRGIGAPPGVRQRDYGGVMSPL